eukprot:Nk52_evm7s2226 gene=Nk52_evmTU7s2226
MKVFGFLLLVCICLPLLVGAVDPSGSPPPPPPPSGSVPPPPSGSVPPPPPPGGETNGGPPEGYGSPGWKQFLTGPSQCPDEFHSKNSVLVHMASQTVFMCDEAKGTCAFSVAYDETGAYVHPGSTWYKFHGQTTTNHAVKRVIGIHEHKHNDSFTEHIIITEHDDGHIYSSKLPVGDMHSWVSSWKHVENTHPEPEIKRKSCIRGDAYRPLKDDIFKLTMEEDGPLIAVTKFAVHFKASPIQADWGIAALWKDCGCVFNGVQVDPRDYKPEENQNSTPPPNPTPSNPPPSTNPSNPAPPPSGSVAPPPPPP